MALARAFRAQAATQLPAATCRPLLGQAAIDSHCGASAGSLRAQAAMEYLVTYGWALLALFVVLAYLLSTGAFSADSFSAQECTFQPDLSCSPYILFQQGSTSTALRFTLTNGLGFPINVTSVNYTVTNIGSDGKHVLPGAVPPAVVPSGAKMNFSMDFDGSYQPAPRDFRTVLVSLEYTNCRNTPCSGPYVTSGRISATVQGK